MANAQINSVRIDHNLWEGGVKGMVIHVGFDVQDLMGRQGQVSVYFNYWQGGPLTAFDSLHRSPDGHLLVSNDFVPQFAAADFPDFQLFMPYEALHMAPGQSALMCKAIIWDMSSPVPQQLASSAWFQFMYTS